MERLTKRELSQNGYVDCPTSVASSSDCNDSCMYKKCKWNEDALKKLKDYEDAEEQGLLLRLPYKIKDAVDALFSHNEIVSLWIKVEKEITYHQLIWNGMAWNIPEELKTCDFVKIFGTIPETITQADTINIEIILSKEAEQALARMEKENG